METWGIIGLIIGPAGILYMIIKSILDRKKTRASIDFQDSATLKTDAEAEKIKAEAEKIKAEAYEVNSNTALNIAQRLNEECKQYKAELKEKDDMLDKTEEKLKSIEFLLQSAQDELKICRIDLLKERQLNLEMTQKNAAMWSQIVELTAELKKKENAD